MNITNVQGANAYSNLRQPPENNPERNGVAVDTTKEANRVETQAFEVNITQEAQALQAETTQAPAQTAATPPTEPARPPEQPPQPPMDQQGGSLVDIVA